MADDHTKPPSGQLDERVLAWLESEGYPLEFRTARILRDCHFGVDQGKHYRAEDGGPREIDVVGEVCTEEDGTFLRISHYIECKWSKGYPWVVFASEHAAIAPSACVAQTQGNDLARATLWCLAGDADLHQSSIFATPRRVGFGGRQAFTKAKDQFYSAMQGIVGATQSEVAATTRPDLGLADELAYGEIGLPVIVIDGELFEAFWDESSHRMKVEPRTHIRLHWQGSSAWHLRASVDIVTVESLEPFMLKRRAEIDQLLPKMSAAVAEFRTCLRERSLDTLTITRGSRGYTGLPAFLRRLRSRISNPEASGPSLPSGNPPEERSK